MIFLFFESALVLILFNLDFFAFLFIIVYVGAVAVLFLFIVMLLEVKIENFNILYFFSLNFFFNFLIINFFFNFLNSIFYNLTFYPFNSIIILNNSIDILSDINVLGQMLFNHYIFCFIFAGLILLVALIGAISLSYDFNLFRTKNVIFRQLNRSSNTLLFFQ
jgi:NADH-quinone oxidoreductase subunit J